MCAKCVQNVWCSSRIKSVFTKRPRPAKMMLGKALSPFCIPVTGHVKIGKYAKFDPNIPYGSGVMSIFTNWSH